MEQDRIDVGTTTFTEPVKRIFDSRGTHVFQSSVAMIRLKKHLHKYLGMLSGQRIPSETSNPNVIGLRKILHFFSKLVDETPALPGPRRYGNLACRDWHDKMEEQIREQLQEFLPEKYYPSIVELAYYLGNAFGSRERLDYGTGHELSFFSVICALDMLGIWGSDFQAKDLLYLFNEYYSLVRKLITKYSLEPAGSHGVWGLDDHFHLIYIFGASQWADSKDAEASPREIQNKMIVDEYAGSNFYCQAISFIFKVKSGPFSEHSPMLYDISRSVPTWSKVQRGLLKMYFAEVLNKFPVVQHFWFGTALFPWTSTDGGDVLPTYEVSQETDTQAQLPRMTQHQPSMTKLRHPMNPPHLRNVSRFIAHDRLKKG